MLKAALWYASKGMSIIPVGQDKKPLLKWQKYQQERAGVALLKEWWGKWPAANIGIVTGEISGVCVVDIDTDEGRETFNGLISDSLQFPTANTPKGGQHCYFQHNAGMRNNCRVLPGCDFRGDGGYIIAPPSETPKGKYKWLSSAGLHEIEAPPLPGEYIDAVTTCDTVVTPRYGASQTVTMFENGRRDEDLFHVANCMVKGGMPEKEAVQVVRVIMRSWGEDDERWALDKVQSAISRKARKGDTLAEEVRQWILSTTGNFLSTDVYRELHLSTREEKKNLSIILKRLSGDGLIAREGNKHGSWRRPDGDCIALDFMSASPAPLNIDLPFKLSQMVHVYPKNIVVVAGTFDSGKTAFMLEVASEAMKQHKVHYYSSEMAEQELRRRLEKTGIPLEQWQTVDFRERARDFADVIHPDDINIIDFMELHEEPYLVGKYIRQVYEKLNKGVAFIGIQKKPGNDVGVGGIGSAEKPRLYLTMDRDRQDKRQVIVSIEKAKNWAQAVNPNGLKMLVEVVDGCRFKTIRDWHRDEG